MNFYLSGSLQSAGSVSAYNIFANSDHVTSVALLKTNLSDRFYSFHPESLQLFIHVYHRTHYTDQCASFTLLFLKTF